MTFPIPDNEKQRLLALRSLGLLDTEPEPAFDDLVRLAASICETPVALFSLVDETRQWSKAAVGAPSGQSLARELSFCASAIMSPHQSMIVSDTLQDERTRDNPLSLAFRFYASCPLLSSEGLPLGTLCALDTVPRELSAHQLWALEALSRQASDQLELRRQILRAEEAGHQLREAQERAERLSVMDSLTGLRNGRYLTQALQSEFSRSRRHNHQLSYIRISADAFERLALQGGRPFAENALQWIAKALSCNARASDVIAREEECVFGLLLPDTNLEGAWALAEKLRFEIESLNIPGVSISAGASSLRASDQSAKDLQIAAADALERSLACGGNQVTQRRP